MYKYSCFYYRLHCKCNWLVIPNVDLYDKQIFTCPTDKVTTNLVDGSERTGDTRNENIYRRKWNGSRNDFINRVRNGTIDSFCDPKSSGMKPLSNLNPHVNCEKIIPV